MTSPLHFFLRILGIFALTLFAGTTAHAESPSFTANLTEENKTAVGLAKLSPAQLAALDAQITREISLARQGDTPAFSTPFTRRRTPLQRTAAGLDQLMTPELNRLDELVALAVANRPAPAGPLVTSPAVSTPPGNGWVEVSKKKLNVHGEATLAYMWGSGGSGGYGASLATTVSDPDDKYALTFVLSQFRYKGPRIYTQYPCYVGW